MMTKENFIQQYNALTDEALYHMFLQRNQYSDEGQVALIEVIGQRGGIVRLEKVIEEQEAIHKEIRRIEHETRKLAVPGVGQDFITKMVVSERLSTEQVSQIVTSQFAQIELERKDQCITPRTIWGSIAGGSLAALIGGVIWGLQLIQMHRMFWILAIGIYMLAYGIIKWFTKQSKNNTIVLVASCLATGLAIGIGFLLFEIFGS